MSRSLKIRAPTHLATHVETPPKDLLRSMADAAVVAVECVRALHERGSNVVAEVLRGYEPFTELEHYPPDDVYDAKSGALFYFHAHGSEARNEPDYGHFHTFLRSKDESIRSDSEATKRLNFARENRTALSHLVAISMSPEGLPVRLFTTNRWVTDETWSPAPRAIALLERFYVGSPGPAPLVNRWVTAMLALFRPQIELLLRERDRTVDLWGLQHPGADTFEDRRLDITSSMDVSLYEHIDWIDQEMEALVV